MRNPEPLTPDELQRLWRWERNMLRFHAAAMPLLVLCAGAALTWGDSEWMRRALLGLVMVMLAAAAFLQMREKCPRCGARLHTKLLLRLPERCWFCGVTFERPPAS